MAFPLMVATMATLLATGLAQDNCMQQALDAHNRYRAMHGINTPMTWDSRLAMDTQNYANQFIGANCDIQHGQNGGENIFGCNGANCGDCATAVRDWYNEIQFYTWRSNQPYAANRRVVDNGDVLHMTQVIWKDSTRLGCAIIRGPNQCVGVLCRYNPVGNMNLGNEALNLNVPPRTDGREGEAACDGPCKPENDAMVTTTIVPNNNNNIINNNMMGNNEQPTNNNGNNNNDFNFNMQPNFMDGNPFNFGPMNNPFADFGNFFNKRRRRAQ